MFSIDLAAHKDDKHVERKPEHRITEGQSPAPYIDEAALRAALDSILLDSLRPTIPVLIVLLIILAVGYLQAPYSIAVPTVIVTSLVTLVLCVSGVFLYRGKIALRHANAVGAVLAFLVIAQRLLFIALSEDPMPTANLILTLVGAGFLLLSTRWFLGVAAVTLAAWGLIAWRAPPSPAWGEYGFALVSATALSIIMHFTRLRSLRRQEGLRFQNESRHVELARRALQLETLIATGSNITAILDLNTLLAQVVDLVQARFGYYYVGIFLLDKTGEYLVSRAGTGEAGRRLSEKGFRFKIGDDSLIGWVGHHRELARVNDVSQDARYVGLDAVPDTRAELVLPLEVGDALLGALDMQSDQLAAFTDDDVRVFQSLADQVAIAVENAASYQEEHSRRLLTETLYEVSRALSQTLDLEEVLDLILEDLAQIIPFDRGSVMLKHDSFLEIVSAYGFPPESNPLQIHISIKEDDVFQQIYYSKQPLIVPEVLKRADWQQVEGLPQARSWLGVPLINAQDEVIGILSLTRESPTSFSEDEGRLAMAFAGQGAIALQNAQLYSELERAYGELERLDRTKSDFISVASHELRTPLTVMQGFSQMLLQDTGGTDDATRQEMVRGIYRGAIRLNEIINSMLDVAKIDTSALQLFVLPVSVLALLQELLRKFQGVLAERHLTASVSDWEVLPTVEADPEALKKVFRHLIVNAIKYTPDGGHITLSGRPIQAGTHDLPVDGVEIVVRDTGIGIDPRLLDLIFAKFYQTGELALHSSGTTSFKGGGPGLGLAIVKGIVEAHGGKVWAESPGHDEETCPGSSFHVVLPLRQKAV